MFNPFRYLRRCVYALEDIASQTYHIRQKQEALMSQIDDAIATIESAADAVVASGDAIVAKLTAIEQELADALQPADVRLSPDQAARVTAVFAKLKAEATKEDTAVAAPLPTPTPAPVPAPATPTA